MPTYYDVDIDLEVVHSVISGDVTADDLRDNMFSIHHDPRVQPHFGTLVDLSRVISLDMDFEALAALSDFYFSDAVPRMTGRLAYYVPERDVIYGLTRQLHALLNDEDRIEVFTDMAKARDWLGLPPEEGPRDA